MGRQYQLHVPLPDDLRRRLSDAAADERRSLSNLVRCVLEDYLKTR